MSELRNQYRRCGAGKKNHLNLPGIEISEIRNLDVLLLKYPGLPTDLYISLIHFSKCCNYFGTYNSTHCNTQITRDISVVMLSWQA